MPDTRDMNDQKFAPEPAPRQSEPGEVLRARPVKGPIDYAELIRDTMAKPPKILAYLAM